MDACASCIRLREELSKSRRRFREAMALQKCQQAAAEEVAEKLECVNRRYEDLLRRYRQLEGKTQAAVAALRGNVGEDGEKGDEGGGGGGGREGGSEVARPATVDLVGEKARVDEEGGVGSEIVKSVTGDLPETVEKGKRKRGKGAFPVKKLRNSVSEEEVRLLRKMGGGKRQKKGTMEEEKEEVEAPAPAPPNLNEALSALEVVRPSCSPKSDGAGKLVLPLAGDVVMAIDSEKDWKGLEERCVSWVNECACDPSDASCPSTVAAANAACIMMEASCLMPNAGNAREEEEQFTRALHATWWCEKGAAAKRRLSKVLEFITTIYDRECESVPPPSSSSSSSQEHHNVTKGLSQALFSEMRHSLSQAGDLRAITKIGALVSACAGLSRLLHDERMFHMIRYHVLRRWARAKREGDVLQFSLLKLVNATVESIWYDIKQQVSSDPVLSSMQSARILLCEACSVDKGAQSKILSNVKTQLDWIRSRITSNRLTRADLFSVGKYLQMSCAFLSWPVIEEAVLKRMIYPILEHFSGEDCFELLVVPLFEDVLAGARTSQEEQSLSGAIAETCREFIRSIEGSVSGYAGIIRETCERHNFISNTK